MTTTTEDPAPFAAAADLAARWRPLSDAEQTVAETLLGDASEILRTHVPDLDARLASGELRRALVVQVVTAMVRRAMANPGGATSRTHSIDDWTQTERYDAAREGLYVGADELALLSPADESAGAFTIGAARRARPYATGPDAWWPQ